MSFANVRQTFSFKTRELVIIGLFAGAAKAASLVVALMGGGMNPLTLILKNGIWAALWLVLLIKVERPGTLTLSHIIAALLGLFLLGSSMLSMPVVIAACIFAEILMFALSKVFGRVTVAVVGIAISELIIKAGSLGIGLLSMREQPMLIIPVAIIIAVGYIGVLLGLFGGSKMVKELRHAGLIQN